MITLRNFRKLVRCLMQKPSEALWFIRCYREWQRTAPNEWRANLNEILPMLGDRHANAGSASGHYFLQDLWAAQLVYHHKSELHVDVASRLDGFVAHVVSFLPVQYVDIRPLKADVPGLVWANGTIYHLPYPDKSVASLSCLHVIEHVGLGRYGDPIDPDGWLRGLRELARVLAPSGQLLIGTPCGRSRTVFHAHRVFSPLQIIKALPELKLLEFSLIENDSAVKWIKNAEIETAEKLEYACGLFRFTR